MSSVRDHYEEVLGEHYSRMFGDFEAKVAEQRALLERLGVTGRADNGLAVDLGCGSGFQSVYRKLRLSIDSAIRYLERSGLTVERHPAPGGLVALLGTRSGSGRTASADRHR